MLRILSLFLGPIFAKEMVEMARRKRYYLNRVLYGLVLLFTLLIVYENFSWQWTAGKPSIRLMALIAEALFHGISIVQFGAAFLLVPLFLCGVIASEREERTLELLFTTNLSDRQIVLGKLGSRLAALVFLILCGLPVISLVMFFGGIDPDALWRIMSATMLAIFYAGAHSIYFSTITKSPMGAVVRTYWYMALWLLALPVAVFLPVAVWRLTTAAMWVACSLPFVNPIGCFVVAIQSDAYQQMAGLIAARGHPTLSEWFFPLTFVMPLAWSCLLVWRAIVRLRLAPTTLSLWISKLHLPGGALRQQAARWTAARRRAGAERIWFLLPVFNPLWLRARLARVYDREGTVGRIQWAAWAVAAFFVGLLAFTEPRAVRESEAARFFLMPTWIAVAALFAIVSGSSLVGDRRRGFLDLILLTPMTAREVVDGTLLSIWQHVQRVYWLPWALGLFFCLTGSTNLTALFYSMLTATLFCAVLLLHGIACSLTAQSAAGALVPTFSFPVIMIAGLPFLTVIFPHGSGPAVWVLTAIVLVVAWVWARRGATPAAVGCAFFAVHLALTAIAMGWTVTIQHHDEYPLAAMNAGYLTVMALITQLDRPWLYPWYEHRMSMLLCYWAALTVNFLWARWWLIRNFDRLVERPLSAGKPRTRPTSRAQAVAVRPVAEPEKVQPVEPVS